MSENTPAHPEAQPLTPQAKKSHARESIIVWIIATACLVTLGWYARQFTFKMPNMGGNKASGHPKVMVREVTEDVVNPPRKYVGTVDAIQSVDIRARVVGYLKEVAFQEGAFVKEGDLLFTIDDEDYAARVAQRRAEIEMAVTALDRDEKVLKRLESADPRSISQLDLDNARADVASKKAALSEAKANLQLAEIDLKHTKVYAPIAGRIGKKFVSKGDYISTISTSLAKIVQVDPIRVVFSVPDREAFKLNATKQHNALRGRILLPDGTEYDNPGSWDFIGNEMASDTATLPIWLRVPNTGLLLPGTFVTVLVDGTTTQKTPVVDIMAVTRNVQGAYVYTVNASNIVEMCRVHLGQSNEKVYAIESGLKKGDRVIIEGIQNVRPGVTVEIIPGSTAQGTH
jgi:membrane fusion protein (multidrug efflux system)